MGGGDGRWMDRRSPPPRAASLRSYRMTASSAAASCPTFICFVCRLCMLADLLGGNGATAAWTLADRRALLPLRLPCARSAATRQPAHSATADQTAAAASRIGPNRLPRQLRIASSGYSPAAISERAPSPSAAVLVAVGMRRSQSSSSRGAAREEPIDVDAIPTPPPVPAAAIQQLRDMIGASEAR